MSEFKHVNGSGHTSPFVLDTLKDVYPVTLNQPVGLVVEPLELN